MTSLEQTDSQGAPLDEEFRWRVPIVAMKRFSLSEYLLSLFTAPPGYYRILMFVVTKEPFRPDPRPALLETVETWSAEGFDRLPFETQAAPFTPSHSVAALVYEFVKQTDADQPSTSIPGRITAPTHLRSTNLSALLP